ncbi:hypothetical protein HanRHA438_Chr00c07g0846321 [Helianthus annuus]|nr:hypothetical protein HanRHA438_Chr00c07g0846321 [Helianthus annuus]
MATIKVASFSTLIVALYTLPNPHFPTTNALSKFWVADRISSSENRRHNSA